MTLASGCTSRNLIKIGEGSLKALVVFFVTGITSISSMRGFFAELRINYIEKKLQKENKKFNQSDLNELEKLWNEAKIDIKQVK